MVLGTGSEQHDAPKQTPPKAGHVATSDMQITIDLAANTSDPLNRVGSAGPRAGLA